MLPPQLHNKRARRNARCSALAPTWQPLVPVAHSTHASEIPSLIDVRVAARPSLVRVETPPPLHARAVPPLVLEPASDQQHLAPLRKKARVAVRIVDGNAQSQCIATAYGGYGAAASVTFKRRKSSLSQEKADAAPASIAFSSSAATAQRVYCYAVASRAAQVQKNFGLLHTATSQENLCVALAPSATSQENLCVALAPFATSQESQFKERVTECIRNRTLASRAHERIPGTARIASPSALNSTRPACDKLFTSREPPTRDEILPTSALALTPTVFPVWQHLHRAVIAQCCEADTRMRNDVRSCTPLKLAPLYIKCSPQHSQFFSRCHASLKVFFATRRLFPQVISSDAKDRLFNRASIGSVRVDNATLSRQRRCAV